MAEYASSYSQLGSNALAPVSSYVDSKLAEDSKKVRQGMLDKRYEEDTARKIAQQEVDNAYKDASLGNSLRIAELQQQNFAFNQGQVTRQNRAEDATLRVAGLDAGGVTTIAQPAVLPYTATEQAKLRADAAGVMPDVNQVTLDTMSADAYALEDIDKQIASIKSKPTIPSGVFFGGLTNTDIERSNQLKSLKADKAGIQKSIDTSTATMLDAFNTKVAASNLKAEQTIKAREGGKPSYKPVAKYSKELRAHLLSQVKDPSKEVTDAINARVNSAADNYRAQGQTVDDDRVELVKFTREEDIKTKGKIAVQKVRNAGKSYTKASSIKDIMLMRERIDELDKGWFYNTDTENEEIAKLREKIADSDF